MSDPNARRSAPTDPSLPTDQAPTCDGLPPHPPITDVTFFHPPKGSGDAVPPSPLAHWTMIGVIILSVHVSLPFFFWMAWVCTPHSTSRWKPALEMGSLACNLGIYKTSKVGKAIANDLLEHHELKHIKGIEKLIHEALRDGHDDILLRARQDITSSTEREASIRAKQLNALVECTTASGESSKQKVMDGFRELLRSQPQAYPSTPTGPIARSAATGFLQNVLDQTRGNRCAKETAKLRACQGNRQTQEEKLSTCANEVTQLKQALLLRQVVQHI
jgi:hypothetical protein